MSIVWSTVDMSMMKMSFVVFVELYYATSFEISCQFDLSGILFFCLFLVFYVGFGNRYESIFLNIFKYLYRFSRAPFTDF